MNERILIVDDEDDIRTLLSTLLARAHYNVTEADSAATLRLAFEDPEPAVLLLDLKLPDAEGLDLLPVVKKRWPDVEVIVLTGNASLEAAVLATKLGAYDFQKKPFETKSFLLSVERALEHRRLREEACSLRNVISAMSGQASPIFQSPSMKSAVRTVERVAPTDVSVLITGESGTGKEVIADLLHSLSLRNKGPFVKVNCAALPRELIESELFGSVKGAFTGAQADRDGLFRQAEGGTLLLDELSEMPIDTQSKLLRVLQEKEVRPVGGRTCYKSDVRIIAATNREIEEAIKGGKLREDLFYRISAISISLPPLRERREDIIPLATAFLKRFSAQANRVISGFTPEAADQLRKFDWPGNVRQLQNEIQRAVLMSEGAYVQAAELSIAHPVDGQEGNASLFEAMERGTIVRMLQETSGNK